MESIRTFIDVRDAVRAYWLLITKCIPGEVYNIGGVETMKIKEMLDRLLELSSAKNIKMYIDYGEFELAILSYSIVDTTYEDVINYANRKGLG